MKPTIIHPFATETFDDLRNHIAQVRRCFDWPGIPMHDAAEPEENRFNRWFWHNLPLLRKLHNGPEMIKIASDLAGMPLKPSYVFLSMYGKDGVCPKHTDRPQCQFTIDLVVRQDGTWPIYVDEIPYELGEGEALFYSGTGQPHYRKKMAQDGRGLKNGQAMTFCDLAFFHFVSIDFQGQVG